MPNYIAVTKYASRSVTRVAERVSRPELTHNLAMVKARPSTVKQIPAAEVEELILALTDVRTLANVIDGNDRRLVVRRAVVKHPKYARAIFELDSRAHPWREWDLDTVVQHIDRQSNQQPENPEWTRLIVSWCRTLPVERRPSVYRRLMPRVLCVQDVFPYLAVDVLAGHVPGVQPSDCGICTAGEEDRPTRTRQLNPSLVHQVLQSYERIDLGLAKVAADHEATIPVSSVEGIDDDAVDHLLATSSVVELVESGAVSEHRRLLPLVTTLQPRVRCRLAFLVNDPVVVAALLGGLLYNTGPGVDLFDILDKVADLDLETRLVALSHANVFELKDYFSGRYLNQPQPGELPTIVDRATGDGGGWYVQKLPSLVHALGLSAPSVPVFEGIDHVIDTRCAVASLLLQNDGLIGRRVVQRLSSVLGDNPAVWEMLLRLAEDWAGTVDDLAAAARLL